MRFRRSGLGIALFAASFPLCARAQNAEPAPRRITLSEAVQLALKNNHVVRTAGYEVQMKQHAKEAARSGYFPQITNESRVLRVTDTQFIDIPAGSLGTVGGTPIPTAPTVLNQGGKTFITSGTGLVQPLTQLFTRVKPSNDLARADLNATRANEKETENDVALRVHEIYYQILVTKLHKSATEAKIRAAQEMESERAQQVKYGSTLDEQLIESRAQTLENKQDLLTTELQLSDLTMQLNDVLALPVTMQLELDPAVPEVQEPCRREECVSTALASHPEILAAKAEVEKASAGVRLSRADYFPDISAFARYSYSDNLPFLARNFGTFGAELTYDLFDGGRRKAKLGESNAGLGEARENLARITDEVERKVETAANKLAQTKEMIEVSRQILTLRTESSRVTAQKLQRGEALPSQADTAIAQEFDARTLLLQSQLSYVQARDEMIHAIGRTPE
jgi:outer membrane protein TolC